MRARILLLAGLLLGLLACLPGLRAASGENERVGGKPADEMAQVVAAAEAFWTATGAHDETTQRRIASDPGLDLVRVLGSLLREHAKEALGGASASPQLAAAETLVRLAQGNLAARGAAQVLATWKAWDRATLEREVRLRAAADAIEQKETQGDLEEVLAALEKLRPELAPARGSLLACFLQQDLGLIAWRLGRTELALADTRASRALAASLPWPGGELRALRYEFSLALDLGDFDLLERVARETTTLALACGWTHRAIAAALDSSMHLRNASRYSAALSWAREAQALAGREGDPDESASALLAEAKVRAVTGSTREALEIAERVRRDPANAFNLGVQVEALTVSGFVNSRADRFAEALHSTDQALALLGGRDDPTLLANVWTNRGGYLRRMGQLEAALECQLQAVASAERAGHTGLLGIALGNLGVVQQQLGLPESSATLERALAAKRKAGDQVGMLETALNLGAYQARQASTRAQGLRLLEQIAGALAQANAPPQLAGALTTLAQAYVLGGDPTRALATTDRALETLRAFDDRSQRLANACETRAKALLELGRPAEALESAREAMGCRRGLASGLGEDDATHLVLSAREASDLVVTCALALSTQEPSAREGLAATAFEALESGRATLLAAGVVQAESLLAAEVSPDLVAAEAAARSKVVGARTQVVAASSRPTRDAAIVSQAKGNLESAWKAHAEIVARFQREARRAAGVVFPAPITLEALRKRLPQSTALVSYQLSSARAIALVARAEGTQLIELGAAADLTARVEQYVGLTSAPESDDRAPAAALYETLVRPLEAHLGGATRLVFAPDAALTFLPFEALRRVEGSTSQRLIERWEVAYVPSATVWASLEDEQAAGPGRGASGQGSSGQGFVGLGDPAYATGPDATPGLTPLPRSGEEVRTIGALYPAKGRTLLLGKDATLARLLAAVPKAPTRLRALHLACHAFVDAQHPRLSALALAGGDLLDLDALYRLRVPADLCVLSACSTARGRWLQGEGVLGFVRGFFFAGVPRVVVSDWVVEDESARTLMEAFHTGLTRNKLGAAAALRQAKLAALKTGGAAAHPSSWAAFVLWGLPD